ncbi:MAG TPA: hypothetical protein VF575_02350 [Candidatus Saccharimonadales bacterium]
MNLSIGRSISRGLVIKVAMFAVVLLAVTMVSTFSASAAVVAKRDRVQSCTLLGGKLRGTTTYHEYQTKRGGQWYVSSASVTATSKYVQSLWGPDATWRYTTYSTQGPALAGHYKVTYKFKATRALTAPEVRTCTTR